MATQANLYKKLTMLLTNIDIKQLLQLRSSELIAPEIADRQTEVIRKAYNYLNISDEHSIIYIADEVGLGKTYIALGIAMLRRHFSENPRSHRDLVIVPKANLQVKWQREARAFLQKNYLAKGKETIMPITETEIIKSRLEPIASEAAMTIFRMSSFSALFSRSGGREKSSTYWKLLDQCTHDEWAKYILDDAWSKGYFNNQHEDQLRCLLAYLLNGITGKVDTIIVDEAHNYRHGLGSSKRNIVTSYFLGAVRDEALLEKFPELEARLHFPLAVKTICLSATPKDRNLKEIGQQLDCFLPKHPLKDTDEDDFIPRLKRFMIRGNMTYRIDDEDTSRHSCRQEHRKGNVKKSTNSEVLEVKDDFIGAFWQLLQYQSIKHLNEKGNATFEMGMLAGFETYQLDAKKRFANYHSPATDQDETQEDGEVDGEYEEINIRQIRESEDKPVIEKLASSFYKQFGELPPHPKQTPMEEELLCQMMRQEKSLVFVRRVHSAIELSGRLLRKFEEEMAKKLRFEKPFSRFTTKGVKDILAEHKMRGNRAEIEAFFKDMLCRRIQFDWFKKLDEKEQLEYCLYSYKHNEIFMSDIERLKVRQRLRLSDEFLKNFEKLKKEWDAARSEEPDGEIIDEDDELEQSYFFNEYFRKGRPGHRFRKRMSEKKLFDLKDDMNAKDESFLSRLLNEICSKEFEMWKRRSTFESDDWNLLRGILQGIFRNGAGLLPAFVADAKRSKFANDLLTLLMPNAPFGFVTEEVRTILCDFDLIKAVNFSDRSLGNFTGFFKGISPVTGRTGQTGGDRSRIAAQFRMPGFPYILVATDIFREGEDLHTYCQNVYHYGIAWNPSDIEQRTGRIDRINSQSYRKLTQKDGGGNEFDNQIHIFYPYLQRSVEVNQVFKLFRHINHFMETFNEIEQKIERDSKVEVGDPVKNEIPIAVIPKRGRFELEEFEDFN